MSPEFWVTKKTTTTLIFIYIFSICENAKTLFAPNRQGTEPANLGFRGLSNFLILIKSIPDWLSESHYVKKSDHGNTWKRGVEVTWPILKVAIFFLENPIILYINRTALKARTKFCMVIHRFFSAVRKILSKMCGHVTQFWRHRFFFPKKLDNFNRW